MEDETDVILKKMPGHGGSMDVESQSSEIVVGGNALLVSNPSAPEEMKYGERRLNNSAMRV